MKKSNGTLITIIAMILIAIGVFNDVNILPVRHSGIDSTCPDKILSDNFKVYFSNEGNAGGKLCVQTTSDDVNFTKDYDCLFISPDHGSVPFNFLIDVNTFPEEDNITINYNYTYNKFFIFRQQNTLPCKYKKYQSNYWELII